MDWQSLLIQFPLAGIFGFVAWTFFKNLKDSMQNQIDREKARADALEAKNTEILAGAGEKIEVYETEIRRLNADLLRRQDIIIPAMIDSTNAMKSYQDILLKMIARAGGLTNGQ